MQEFPGEQANARTAPEARARSVPDERLWRPSSADMVAHMKTTIELPRSLLEQAKKLAAREGSTLRELMETALRNLLEERKAKRKPFKLKDGSVGGSGLAPGLEWKDMHEIILASYGDRGGDPL
jgi:hypothetical protein